MRKLLFIALLFLAAKSGQAQSPEAHFQKAFDQYDSANYNMALVYVDSALSADPKNTEYLMLKANTLAQLKKFEEAYMVYTSVIKLNPMHSIAYNQRGILLNTQLAVDEAIEDFDAALQFEKADSMRLSLLLNRGAAKSTIRNFAGAYEDYVAALKIDSNNIGVLNNIATVCDEVGKGSETLSYLFRIVQIDPSFIGAYGNIGFKYQEMGEYKTAISYFDKVLSLEKDEPLAYNNRGYNKYKLGDLKGALADVNHSIELYPANAYAYRNRALILLALNRKKEACAAIDEALNYEFTKMYGEEMEMLKAKTCK